MNILLISPPCRIPNFLPLGLGYIASVLRQDGHDITLLDINGFGYSQEEVEQKIKTFEYDMVGIGGLTSTYKYVKWLAATVKKHRPNTPVMVGNMVATASPELLLKNSAADIAVIDEGELTVRELVPAIAGGHNLRDVKGIYYKEDGNIIRNPMRERITNLDALPFPAWNLFPMEVYLNNSTTTRLSFGMRTINVFTTRGCPYDCTFCSHPFGRKVYRRSARNVIDEIRQLRDKYRASFIYFGDDLFLSHEKWVLEICERLISEGLNVKWSATGRVNLVNDDLLQKMHKAGCVELSFGFESGSQAMLDSLRKRVTVGQAEEAIEMTRSSGISVAGSFIIGMPGESLDTINETLKFIKRTRLPVYRFFYANPYPGTELYEIARLKGRLPQDEDEYLESLGEMRDTFLINLTDFSDDELVRLKNLAEKIARRSLGFTFAVREFLENWLRRFIVMRKNFKKSGIVSTAKMILSKVRHKAGLAKDG